MPVIPADTIVSTVKELGVKFIVTLPDSRLWGLEGKLKADPAFTFFEVVNEGEGIAICAGIWMGGGKSIMLMEDTGFYEGASALEKFGNQNEIPVVMLVGYHPPLGERNWFQVSRGPITIPLLEALRIPHVVVNSGENINEIMTAAYATAYSSKRPIAILCGTSVK